MSKAWLILQQIAFSFSKARISFEEKKMKMKEKPMGMLCPDLWSQPFLQLFWVKFRQKERNLFFLLAPVPAYLHFSNLKLRSRALSLTQ